MNRTFCAFPHTNNRTGAYLQERQSSTMDVTGRNRTDRASLKFVPLVCVVLLCVSFRTRIVIAHPRDHRAASVQRPVEDTEIGQLLSNLVETNRDGDDYSLEEEESSRGMGTSGGSNGSVAAVQSPTGSRTGPDRVYKRSLSNLEIQPINDDTNYTVYYVGVLMASHLDSPFDLERCGPAIDLALELVNQSLMKMHNVRLSKVQRRHLPSTMILL
uniref:Uncharacterized protein n=1 Tax=Anopheles maculatus TaxID=74869 RepID=A0A182SAB6_9DIPT